KLLTPRHTTGECASTSMSDGVGNSGVTRSYSLPTSFASLSPSLSPVPSKTHDDASPTTMSALTGLHSYESPIIELSGRGLGFSRQLVVARAGSTFASGSSPADR